MPRTRSRLTTALGALALTTATVLTVVTVPALADPDEPRGGSQQQSDEPTLDEVKDRVDRLYRQAEEASERANDGRLRLRDLRADLAALRSDQGRQRTRLERVRGQVRDAVVSRYEGQDLSAVGRVVVSGDPSEFVDSLTTLSAVGDLQADLYGDYATEVKALDLRRSATRERVAELSALQDRLARDKETVDDRLADAEDLLADLEAEQREALLSGSSRAVVDVPASGRAAAAVQYAMAQVGKAYVYGAAGPSAFDCSGLTMMAWAQAGVGLPHSSSAQYSTGPHIAESDLQPGDLVFYYSPISHVGMYIGNGLIVNALNPGAGVQVSDLHSMPYVGAVRPG